MAYFPRRRKTAMLLVACGLCAQLMLWLAGGGGGAGGHAAPTAPDLAFGTPGTPEARTTFETLDARPELCTQLLMRRALGDAFDWHAAEPDYGVTPTSGRRARFQYTLDLATLGGAARPRPLVSVVVPYYNMDAYFLETLEAIRLQSFQNYEVIVVNDCSDAPGALVQLADLRAGVGVPDGELLVVVDQAERSGLPAARNRGLDAARGDFVVWLDADDLLEPLALEMGVWHLLTRPDAAFVKGFTVGFGAKNYVWHKGFRDVNDFHESNPNTVTSMARVADVRKLQGFRESLKHGLEDWDFWMRAAENGMWGTMIDEPFDWYRQKPAGRRQEDWSAFQQRDDLLNEFRKLYPRAMAGEMPALARDAPDRVLGLPLRIAPEDLVWNPLLKTSPRMLMIVPFFAIGGTEVHNLNLARQLTQRYGYELTIVGLVGGAGADSWLPQFRAVTPDALLLPHFLWRDDYARFIMYLVYSRRPDVIYITTTSHGLALAPFLRASFPDIVVTEYTHMEQQDWLYGGKARQSASLTKVMDAHLASSNFLAAWMRKHGADAGKQHVCPVGVDLVPDSFTRARVRSELGIPTTATVVLYSARLVPQKDPRLAVMALAQVEKALSAAQLASLRIVVVGDGYLRELVESEAAAALRTRVIFLGACSMERARDVLLAADVLLQSSEYEGITTAAFEALAAGLPVVGTAVGGMAELVTPDTGVLVPIAGKPREERARDLAAALASLLTNPDRMRELGAAGRIRILAHFTLDRMADCVTRAICGVPRRPDARPDPAEIAFADEYYVQAVNFLKAWEMVEALTKQ